MSVGGGVARSYVYTDHYAYYEPHIRVCNMHIMHIKSTSEAVSRTSYWLSANQDSIARSHYAEARSQVSPRLARLFAVLLVDLVRNVRDGKSLHRSSLPSSMDTRDV